MTNYALTEKEKQEWLFWNDLPKIEPTSTKSTKTPNPSTYIIVDGVKKELNLGEKS